MNEKLCTNDSYLDRMEWKWDTLWPVACVVIAAMESYDGADNDADRDRARERLYQACRALVRTGEEICPTRREFGQ